MGDSCRLILQARVNAMMDGQGGTAGKLIDDGGRRAATTGIVKPGVDPGETVPIAVELK